MAPPSLLSCGGGTVSNRSRKLIIVGRLINICWFWFKWSAALALLVALIGGAYLYTQIDDQIRQHVEGKLAEHYTWLDVSVDGAQLIEGRGIEVRGISLSDPEADDPQKDLVKIEELLVVCNPTLNELIQNKLDVEQIIVRRPTLRATRESDGSWDVARLAPLPKFGDCSPNLTIEGATVEVYDPRRRLKEPFELRDIHLQVNAQPSDDPVHQAKPTLAVGGSMEASHARHIRISGQVDPKSGNWAFTGDVEGLKVGSELIESLPVDLPKEVEQLKSVTAQAQLQFQASSQIGREPPVEFSVACQLSRGRIDDPRLPLPLTDVHAQIRASNNLLAIDQLSARHGKTTVDLVAQREGLGPNSPLQLTARARKIRIDRTLVERLPEAAKQQWHKYQPIGLIDVDLRLAFDGHSWQPDLVVHFVDVAFSHYKFPYQLERGGGTLAYFADKLNVDLTAYAGEVPIRIQGELSQLGPRAIGWTEIRGNDLPIDEKLLSALPPKGQKVVRSLDPSGMIDVSWRGWRDDPNRAKLHTRTNLTLKQGSLRYEKFPYPLANVRGKMEALDKNWTFRDFEGTNDTGFVTCRGQMTCLDDGCDLNLHFAATDVPLDEELRNALKPDARRLWNDMRPRGRIDLTSEIRYLSATKTTDLKVRVEPLGESTSIESTAFPYRLEKLRGVVTFHNGFVRLSDIRAQHGRTQLVTNGTCQVNPDRSWYLQLQDLSIDRLQPDRDLLMALPAGLRRVVSQLNPTGPVNIRGGFSLSKAGQVGSPVQSAWDVAFNLHRSTLNCGVLLKDVHGEIRLVGNFDGKSLRSRGELAIDSLVYKNLQFTEVLGPLWVDNGRVLLGVWAEKEQGRESRRITAKLCGGTLVSDGWVTLGEPPRYAIQASLTEGDLQRFATESLPGAQKLKGRVLANVEVHGTGRGTSALRGSGTIQLRDTDIYELPAMVQLLKVLRVKSPDATAFTQSDMNFRINGEHLYFDKLDFLGDAVSLYGKGEMNFDREVKLAFHSVVGRNDLPIPLLRNIVGEASQQIMQIHVIGPIDNPRISNEAFPGVTQVLQQLQGDLQGRPVPQESSYNPLKWFQGSNRKTEPRR